MDEMSIASKFMQNMLIKIIESALNKKFGIDLLLEFNDPIKVSFDGNTARIHLNADAAIEKDDLSKLLKNMI